MERRVAITGCGALTAAGADLDRLWSDLASARTHIGPLERFSCPGMKGLLGCEVRLPPEQPGGEAERAARMASIAARSALADSALPAGARERTGVVLGSTLCEERQVSELDDAWAARGAASVDGGFLERIDGHRLAARVAREHELGGPVLLTATACSSGNAAIAWAYDLVAAGAAEAMVAGGVDTLTRLVYSGFSRMGALSKSRCRPFDRRRDGVSFGEGAGVVVLEELGHARRRGARIYAEIAGYGLSNDAHHLTAPEPNGEGFARAMRQALASTGTAPAEVDYVSAHGTGTVQNDLAETRAMKAVFGERAWQVPLSSIKSVIGHTNGAASAIETIVCALALQRQAVPPTAGLTEPDPECDLDYVPGQGRAARVGRCLNLSAGFGGSNVCLLLAEAR